MKPKPTSDETTTTRVRERRWELGGEDIVRLLGFDPHAVEYRFETTRCDEVIVVITEQNKVAPS